ncbi:MAG: aryl-sulfate sulfotransferase [Myxococcales bacterium]
MTTRFGFALAAAELGLVLVAGCTSSSGDHGSDTSVAGALTGASAGASVSGGVGVVGAGSAGMPSTPAGGSPAGTSNGGSPGAGPGGSAGAVSVVGGAGSGEQFVSGVTVTVSKLVSTILIVTWTQTKAADQTWLEFSFAGSSVMTSRPQAGALGAHRDVVLGVPGSTAATVRVVSKLAGVENKTNDYSGTTGAVPSGMPKPTVSMYDATLASPDRWLLGAVENSGTCTDDSCYFNGKWWLYIIDRQGRVVWYYADAASNDVSSFPHAARDGEYLFVEKRAFSTSGTPSVLKFTLDRETYNQAVQVPLLSDAVDMTDDGSLLYDTEERDRGNAELREMDRQGKVRTIWNCDDAFASVPNFLCYSNTVTWDKPSDSVLLSFPEMDTVAQIDRKTGALMATYGAAAGSYAFSPAPWSFVWQHYANITPQGTLLVSSHLPKFTKDSPAGPHQHAFEEFEIDRANKRLVQKWVYGDAQADGAEWALSRGMALKLGNGNLLVNYGTGGVIRELTPDKKTVFLVKFDVSGANDYFGKLVGHNFTLDDLYALNGGGPK